VCAFAAAAMKALLEDNEFFFKTVELQLKDDPVRT
jgi:hypothetical protein